MTSNDLNLFQPIVKVQSFHILSFACQIQVWSFACRSTCVFICAHFVLLRPFLWKFSFETFQNTDLSLFLLKNVDIDPLQTQVFHLSNLSTYSLLDHGEHADKL